ncbi:hypothetical protein J1N35_022724, partial [Gossypium stocksii]
AKRIEGLEFKRNGRGMKCKNKFSNPTSSGGKAANKSLSDSDVQTLKKKQRKEASETWGLGKELGLRVIGDEDDVIRELM